MGPGILGQVVDLGVAPHEVAHEVAPRAAAAPAPAHRRGSITAGRSSDDALLTEGSDDHGGKRTTPAGEHTSSPGGPLARVVSCALRSSTA